MFRLTGSQIEEIITLHKSGSSIRDISRKTKHHRRTVNKYIGEYYEKKMQDLMNEYNKSNQIKVYSINLIGFWMITIGIVFLAVYGLYTIINL